MESIWQNHYTWGNFFIAALILLVFYFALQLADKMLRRTVSLSNYQAAAGRIVHNLLLVYELLALLVLGGVFVLINPLFNGLILALLVLAGFSQFRDYISGRIIQTNPALNIGARIKAGGLKGRVIGMGRLNLQLQAREGLHYVNYTRLLRDGYTLIAGEEVGGLYQLKIRAGNSDAKENQNQQLIDLLATAPYLDWNHKPELRPVRDDKNYVSARLFLKEEIHLYELEELIKEWGYECEIRS